MASNTDRKLGRKGDAAFSLKKQKADGLAPSSRTKLTEQRKNEIRQNMETHRKTIEILGR